MIAKRFPFSLQVLAAGLSLLFVLSLAWLTYANFQAGSEFWQLAVSDVLLSVPLGLLFFSIGLSVAAIWQKRRQASISRRLASRIYWTPRVAGVLIILFVSLFALDVFSENAGLGARLGAFLIHLLPALGMALLLGLAWKWEWIGCLAFLGAALFFMRYSFRDPVQRIGMLLLFSGPMAAIALLFGLNWLWKKEVKP